MSREVKSLKSDQLDDLARKAGEGDAMRYQDLLIASAFHIRPRIYSRVQPAERAEEVIQEVLLSIHRSFKTYQPGRPFIPWLNAIADYRLKDCLRNIYASKESPTFDGLLPDTGESDSVSEGSFLDVLEDALEKLTLAQRGLFVMLKFEGKTIKETAAKTGMSESAVKVAAHRAYQKIRKSLTEKPE